MKNKNEIQQDCARLLKNILLQNEGVGQITAYVALNKKSVFGSRFINPQVFGYLYPETLILLEADGILKEKSKVSTDWRRVAVGEVFAEAVISGVEQLRNSNLYDARLIDPYRISFATITAKNWLSKNGFSGMSPSFSIPSYDPVSRTLTFQNKTIEIPSDSNQNSVCVVLFKNKTSMQKVWDRDEILERFGEKNFDNDKSRIVYDAGREINSKVAIATGIKDLLIVTTKDIAVNPKYLKK